jgi:cytochrome c
MNRWEWTQVGAAVTAAVTVIIAGSWLASGLVETRYPSQPAYRVAGVAAVDLAALQREWPGGLAGRQESRLQGYMSHIEQAVVPQLASAGAGPAAQQPADLGTLLASADATRGANTAKLCMSCHTFEQGGANRVGPNLWAVVGRPIAGHGGFAFSPALSSHGGEWSYEELDKYLASPSRAIPGNKMAFNGIRNPKDRANLLAYLGSLGSAAVPRPAPSPPPAGGGPTAAR